MSKSKLGPVETYKGDPAINVKYYKQFGSVERIVAKFGCTAEVAQQAREWAYDAAVREFWEMAQVIATETFGTSARVFSEGRSGGWLVVAGLGDVAEWHASDRKRWEQFTSSIENDIEYRASDEYIMEMIEANEWAPTPLQAAQHEVEVAEHALECARKRLAEVENQTSDEREHAWLVVERREYE